MSRLNSQRPMGKQTFGVAEWVLAHVMKGGRRTYARSGLLERRSPLMEAGGQYVTEE